MFRRIVVVTASVVALTAGCTSEPQEPDPEPSGAALVEDASQALRELTSVEFDLRTQGALEGFPIRSLQGSATRDGWAFGDVDLQLPTERVQYEFEIGDKPEENPGSPGGPRSPGDSNGNSGGSPGSPAGDPVVTLTDSDDETTTQTLPDHFTPASLLAPDGGLRTLLGDATDLDTESREDIDGVPAWRVSANIPQEQMSQLLPGIPDDVAAKFWVTDSEDAAERTLLRVWLQVPPRTPNEGAVLVELGLTGHNEPVEASSTAATPPDDTNDTNDTEPTEGE